MNVKRHARIAIALASCALITAPAAQASLEKGGRTLSQPQSDDHARTSPAPVVAPFIATGDDHARTHTAAAAISFSATGDDHARTDVATTALSLPVTPPQTVATASSGFDWEDAGLGFGTAAGIALLTAGAVMSTRKLREPRSTSFV